MVAENSDICSDAYFRLLLGKSEANLMGAQVFVFVNMRPFPLHHITDIVFGISVVHEYGAWGWKAKFCDNEYGGHCLSLFWGAC